MKKIALSASVSFVSLASWLAACGGDDINPVPIAVVDAGREAAPPDSSVRDGAGTDGANDGGTDAGTDTGIVDAGLDAPPPPPRVLLSMNNLTTSELLAMDLATVAKNSLVYPGSFGTTFSRGPDPWLLEQKADVVAKLDAREPWKIVSSWAVGLDDRTDGGAAYSDPYAVSVATGGKAYVIRYTRNKIAVIDTAQTVDGGAPTKAIDLAGLVQTGDGDGIVEATFAFYVASRHMLYLLLGNIDRTKVASDGYTILCTTTTPLVVGVDTNTDQIVSLGGTGPGGGIPLTGYNPALGAAGAAAVYDEAADRLLVVSAGCNTPLADGGAGVVTQRVVEEVQLAAHQTKLLLDASALGFPSAFAYIGPHDAVLGVGFEVRRWDPTTTAIGAAIPNAPDTYAFAYDGAGALVGTRTNYLSDGGTSIDVVRTLIADGGTSTLATNPFVDNTGFIGGVEIWPRPPR